MEQESRIAVMAIIVEDRDSVKVHIVSIALDAPNDTISALAGKIGNIPGISVKTAYAGV